jgi:hypothetical protein
MIISHENNNYHLWLLLMLAFLGFSLFAAVGTANAGSLLASWDANSEADLAGYKVYYGKESGNYTKIQDVGNVTSYLAENLDDGERYYFVVTAYDLVGNESEFSQEISQVVATPKILIVNTPEGIELTWTSVSGADHYEIYRSDQAYVEGTTVTASVSATTYVDAEHPVGEANGSYYVVKAVASDGSVLRTFGTVGAFDLDLRRGFNLVSLPVIPDSTNADVTSVLGNVLAGGESVDAADQIMIWRPGEGNYQVVWLAEGFNNAAIDGNWYDAETMQKSTKELDNINAFWVRILDTHIDTSITVTGSVPTGTQTAITLYPGFNFIGSIYPQATAINDLDMLEDQVVAGSYSSDIADNIMEWTGEQYIKAFMVDGTNTALDGQWIKDDGSALSDMQLVPGKGYIIWIKGDRSNDTWTFANPDLE